MKNKLAFSLWKRLIEVGKKYDLTPYGTEAMHVLRAEKGFIIVGQETDGTVTPHDLGMSWIVSKNKNPAEVIPIKTKDYSTLAKRPMFSLLDCSGSNGLNNIVCKYWRHELENIISKTKE